MRPLLHHIHLPNLSSYNWTLGLQQFLFRKVNDNRSLNFILTLEHTPVYTVGLRNDPSYTNDLFQALKLRGAEIHKVKRGGLITFHGPGQLVAYPVINLKNFIHINGVRHYVDSLHDTLLATCFGFGVSAKLDPSNVGVYVGGTGKIASIGVQCRRFVTLHGIALNCNTELDWFNYIVACGLADKKATSLSVQLNRNVSVDEVLPAFLASFSAVFKCNLLRDSSYLKSLQDMYNTNCDIYVTLLLFI